MSDKNIRITPSGDVETTFRREVRLALDLDIFTRDDQIVDEVRRLKNVEREFEAREDARWTSFPGGRR